MTAAEYNELIDLLRCGHEMEFNYDGKTYYLEFVGNNTYELYDITNKKTGILLERIQGKTMDEVVALFMRTPLINGRSFNEVYSSIPFLNVD